MARRTEPRFGLSLLFRPSTRYCPAVNQGRVRWRGVGLDQEGREGIGQVGAADDRRVVRQRLAHYATLGAIGVFRRERSPSSVLDAVARDGTGRFIRRPLRGTAPRIGNGEARAIRHQCSALDERRQHVCTASAIEAEEASGLGKREVQTGHFAVSDNTRRHRSCSSNASSIPPRRSTQIADALAGSLVSSSPGAMAVPSCRHGEWPCAESDLPRAPEASTVVPPGIDR